MSQSHPSESIQMLIPQQQQTYNIQNPKSRSSEIKNYLDQLNMELNDKKVIEIKNRNSKKAKEKKDKPAKSVQENEISKNIIVIEDQKKRPVLEYQYQMLRKLPVQISYQHQRAEPNKKVKLQSVEKISLFTNYLRSFSDLAFQKLSYLKQLNLSENMIVQIPSEQMNQNLISLQVLRLNSNQITVLPYLKHVKQLYMLMNPLRKLTRRILYMNLNVLQIDWMEYLSLPRFSTTHESQNTTELNQTNKKQPTPAKQTYPITSSSNFIQKPSQHQQSSMTPVQVLKYEYIKRLKETSCTPSQQQFCDFKSLFKIKIHQTHSLYIQQTIAQLLSNAIQKQHSFFVDYLTKYFPKLYYNKMNTYNKFLIEDALQIRNVQVHKEVMRLFMPEKWPYDGDFPWVENLFVAVKYKVVGFVRYLIELESAKEIVRRNRLRIVQFLMNEYQETSEGIYIAGVVCDKIFQEENDDEARPSPIQIGLTKYPLTKSKVVLNFWNFIARNQKLKHLILFTKRQSYFQNSILHFAMRSHDTDIALHFLFQIKNQLDIFNKNCLGQTAKSQFAADKLSKKILWRMEKSYLQNRLLRITEQQSDQQILLSLEAKDKMHVPYIKLSRIRTRSIKQIMKSLDLDCSMLRIIFQNCSQGAYLQSQQQISYILGQLLDKFEKINSQLHSKSKTLSSYEMGIICLKIFQTQIFDKRSFLACQIAKILTKKSEEKDKITFDDMNIQDQKAEELSLEDDKLLAEYELMHSISVLKNQRLLVSSSKRQSKQYRSPEKIGYFDVARYGCKKCD